MQKGPLFPDLPHNQQLNDFEKVHFFLIFRVTYRSSGAEKVHFVFYAVQKGLLFPDLPRNVQ